MMLSTLRERQGERERERDMSLATSLFQSNHGDEDYIDMEISCFSPKATRDFEFQMTSTSRDERETTPSPADELFYKGKLLPLHLPPRLQMVQKLLQNTRDDPFTKTPPVLTTNYTNTPLGSCTISPSESRRASSELNPEDYTFEWSKEFTNFISENPKKPKSKKLKLIKQSVLAQKLKASKTYIKSLFTKSQETALSSESAVPHEYNSKVYINSLLTKPQVSALLSNSAESPEYDSKAFIKSFFIKSQTASLSSASAAASDYDLKTKDCFRNNMKATKRSKGANNPTIASVIAEEGVVTHRKSFSGAIKRHCGTKSSSSTSSSGSSSFSSSSNGLFELQILKRSSSAISEIESSIEGAIEHCKQSQHVFSASDIKKGSSEIGVCSISITNNAIYEDKER